MLDGLKRLRYGARPEAQTLADGVAALPEMPTTPIPDGDPIGAQGDKESHKMTVDHVAGKEPS